MWHYLTNLFNILNIEFVIIRLWCKSYKNKIYYLHFQIPTFTLSEKYFSLSWPNLNISNLDKLANDDEVDNSILVDELLIYCEHLNSLQENMSCNIRALLIYIGWLAAKHIIWGIYKWGSNWFKKWFWIKVYFHAIKPEFLVTKRNSLKGIQSCGEPSNFYSLLSNFLYVWT